MYRCIIIYIASYVESTKIELSKNPNLDVVDFQRKGSVESVGESEAEMSDFPSPKRFVTLRHIASVGLIEKRKGNLNSTIVSEISRNIFQENLG